MRREKEQATEQEDHIVQRAIAHVQRDDATTLELLLQKGKTQEEEVNALKHALAVEKEKEAIQVRQLIKQSGMQQGIELELKQRLKIVEQREKVQKAITLSDHRCHILMFHANFGSESSCYRTDPLHIAC